MASLVVRRQGLVVYYSLDKVFFLEQVCATATTILLNKEFLEFELAVKLYKCVQFFLSIGTSFGVLNKFESFEMNE